VPAGAAGVPQHCLMPHYAADRLYVHLSYSGNIETMHLKR
jgi:hypothetical protein